MNTPYDVILKPVITEKTMTIAAEGKYTFLVAPSADKTEIANAVEKLFETLQTMTARQRDFVTSPARQLLSRRLL